MRANLCKSKEIQMEFEMKAEKLNKPIFKFIGIFTLSFVIALFWPFPFLPPIPSFLLKFIYWIISNLMNNNVHDEEEIMELLIFWIYSFCFLAIILFVGTFLWRTVKNKRNKTIKTE
jgi:hypothetical protein